MNEEKDVRGYEAIAREALQEQRCLSFDYWLRGTLCQRY
jgi:hypothetical protein